MSSVLEIQDVKTPLVTATVHEILLVLSEFFPDARWNLACGLDKTECCLTIYADGANAWRVRETVNDLIQKSQEVDGISLVLLVEPLSSADIHGVETRHI